MCKHPLKAFQVGWHEDSGKPKYKIVPYKANHLEQVYDNIDICYDSFISPHAKKVYKDFVEIPCGKCIDCRLQYSRMWADRCMYEALYYPEDSLWFLTLTYDNEHIIDVNHPVFPGTLVKSHFQKFIKRLRSDYEYKNKRAGLDNYRLRFYGCGEYGHLSMRPHFHIIVFGLKLSETELVPWISSKSGHPQWRNKDIEDLWGNGIVTLSKVSWDTCAYTARYTLKKAYKGYSDDLYYENNLEPEFVLMSRKPGIGYKYYEEHKDNIYEFDEIIQRSPDGGRKAKPPRYFDTKLQDEDPELYKRIKQHRKECAEYSKELKLQRTDLDYEELLKVEEEAMMSRIKALKRELEDVSDG